MKNEIIHFEPVITIDALNLIQEQAKKFPAAVNNKKEYDEVYGHHQKIKKLRIAVDKKSDDLVKHEKLKFEKAKETILLEEIRILGILKPIEESLHDTRLSWELEQARIKKEKSEAIAKKQREEIERQQKIKDEIEAHEENARFDQRRKEEAERQAEKERLEAENKRLKEERESFEREKAAFESKKKIESEPEISNDDLKKISEAGIAGAAGGKQLAKDYDAVENPIVGDIADEQPEKIITDSSQTKISDEDPDAGQFETIL
jgi:hypothetical protein